MIQFQHSAEFAGLIRRDLHEALVLLHPDRADGGFGDAARFADLRQQPARFSPVIVADRQGEPDRGAEVAAFFRRQGSARLHRRGGVHQHFGGRPPLTPQADEGGGDVVGAELLKQGAGQSFFFARGAGQGFVVQQTFVVLGLNFLGTRRADPFGDDLGTLQQALGLLVFGRRHDQGRDALVAGAARAARTVQQGFRRSGQVGVDHQFQPGQVDATGRDVGRDADPGAAIAQGLQGVGAFLLGQLARQRHDLKAPVAHAGQQVVHIGAGLAEDQRGRGFVQAQDVEDRMFAVARDDGIGAVVDVGVLRGVRLDRHAQGVLLIGAGQLFDLGRHGGREHQGPAFGGRGGEDEFEIFLKAEIQHLIGFVQHDGLDARQVQRVALDMVAQAARGADDDMRAAVEGALFGAIIHAADAGGDQGGGVFIKPGQLAGDLQGKLARRRDHQGQRLVGVKEGVRAFQQVRGDGQAKGDGLAGAGLGRDEQVAPCGVGRQHGRLDVGQLVITTGGEGNSKGGSGQKGRNGKIGHHVFQMGGALHPREPYGTSFPMAAWPPRQLRPESLRRGRLLQAKAAFVYPRD